MAAKNGEKRVHVGTSVMVMKDRRVLIGKRKGSHGAGMYAFPGGHQEYFEPWQYCCVREVEEETGLKVCFRYFDPEMNQPYAFVTDNIMVADGKHYNTVFCVCDWVAGEPRVVEPDKCEGWEWVTLSELISRMPPEAVARWKSHQFHDALHWFPLAHLHAYREKIGLLL